MMTEATIPFTSYAQNFEDVILWRALKGVEHGFYIDVGACDPVELSVTKAFYDRGWRGINIEPAADSFAKLIAGRPDDINLQVAVTDKSGSATLYETANPALSTLRSELVNGDSEESRFIRTLAVPTVTLAEICRDLTGRDVHFLKIDVEGSERLVLAGMDFRSVRPWILVIEATIPATRISNHHEWEELVEANQYEFVYFDGLSRFYIAQERQHLRPSFRLPPNVFDHFVRHQEHTLQAEINLLRSERAAHLRDTGIVTNELSRCQAEVDLLRSEREEHLRNNEILTNQLSIIEHDRAQRLVAIESLQAENQRLQAIEDAESSPRVYRERIAKLTEAVMRFQAELKSRDTER